MSEQRLRAEVVKTAEHYLGYKESDGSYRQIIDLYNSHKPLARRYPVKYTDNWCAAFVSAIAIRLGLTDIMPTECGCQKMIALYKNLGRWVENDAYVPLPGDIVMYDWADSGNGDNTGYADHVGIVAAVEGKTMRIIEGNRSAAVEAVRLPVNGKTIRGYCTPDYAAKAQTMPDAPVPSQRERIMEWQRAAIADGFSFPRYGADGEWGAECEAVAKKAVCKCRSWYAYLSLTKIVQEAVGVAVDGKFGKDTQAAVTAYQKRNGLSADGAVGINTWKRILGVG